MSNRPPPDPQREGWAANSAGLIYHPNTKGVQGWHQRKVQESLQEVDHRQIVGSPGKKTMDRKLVQLAQIPTTPKSHKYPIAVMGCNALANFTSHARTDFGGCECDDNVDL